MPQNKVGRKRTAPQLRVIQSSPSGATALCTMAATQMLTNGAECKVYIACLRDNAGNTWLAPLTSESFSGFEVLSVSKLHEYSNPDYDSHSQDRFTIKGLELGRYDLVWDSQRGMARVTKKPDSK